MSDYFFSPGLIATATMSAETTGKAYRGFCPGCGKQELRPVQQALGLVYRQCRSCETVAVLDEAPRVKES